MELDDLKSLRYLTAAAKEAMRMYPVVAINGRCACTALPRSCMCFGIVCNASWVKCRQAGCSQLYVLTHQSVRFKVLLQMIVRYDDCDPKLRHAPSVVARFTH